MDCENHAEALQCPTCLKLGIKDSYFCSQDCFKKSWVCTSLQGPLPLQAKHDIFPLGAYMITASI